MWIFLGMVQGPLNFTNRLFPKYVLNFLRIIMHMVGCDLRFIGQV